MTDVMRLALFVCVLVLVVIPDPCRAFLGPSSLSVNTATANPNPTPNPTPNPNPNPNPNCCQQCEAHDSQLEDAVEGALESVFESALRLVSQSLEALFNGVLIKLFAAPGPVVCHATGVSELVKSVWLLRAGHMPHWHQASAAEHSRAADASLVVHVQPSSTYQGYMSQYWQHAPPPPTAHTSSPYGAQAAVEYPTVPSSQTQAPSRPTLQHSNGHISNHHTAGLQHSASALQRTMHFNDFTQEELYLVQHMRSYFQSYTFGSAALEWLTDVDFLRFIRARQGNVQKAIEMLRTHLDWRMEQSVDSIFLEGHESSPLNSVAFWTHENANGCPTIVFRASQFTPELATAEQWQRHLIMLLELGRKELQVGTDKQLCVCIDREEAMRELLGDPALKSSWEWTSEQVDTAAYSTGTNGLYLSIIPDSLGGPKTYWFTCTMYADGLQSVSASVSVYANQIPASGSYQVTPSVGQAFITVFDMQLANWVDSDLPLAFSFAAVIDGKEIPLAASNPRNQLQTILWKPSNNGNMTVLGYVYDSYGGMAWADANVTVVSDGSVSSLSLLTDTQEALTYEKFGEKALRLLLGASSNVSNHTELQTMLDLVSNCSAYVDNDLDNLHQQIIVLGSISDGSASHGFLYQVTTVLSTVVVRYNGSDTASTTFAADVVQLVSVISGSNLFNSSESSSVSVQEVADIISNRAASYLLVPGEAAEVHTASNFQLYTAVFDSEASVEVSSPWAMAVLPSVAFTGPLYNSGPCGNVQVTSTAWVAAANPFTWSDKVDVYAAVIGVELKDCSHTAQSISNLTSPLTFSVIANTSTTRRNTTLGILESSAQTCLTKLDILTFNCSDQSYNVSCASYWPDAVNFTCPFTQTSCVYWDVHTQRLNNSWCYTVEVVAGDGTINTTCACNHLTVFTSTAGSYSTHVQSTAADNPKKSELKRSYAVVICIATLYGALLVCLVVGHRYDQLQEEIRLKKLFQQKPKAWHSLKSPPSVLSMLKSGHILNNSVSSDLSTNPQQPNVIERREGLLERWIKAMMEENMSCVSSSFNTEAPILTAEQKALLFFTKAITLLALSCVVFNNSSASKDPRVVAVMQSSNSNIWIIMVEQLLGELIVQVLVKSIITWLVYASFKESALLNQLRLQSEDRAWKQRHFLFSLTISNRSELYDLRGTRELKALLLQLEALKHIIKAEMKFNAQATTQQATITLPDQIITVTRKLSEVKALLKCIQEERKNTVLCQLFDEIEGKGLCEQLTAYWRLRLRIREEQYETNLYVLTRTMTAEQRLQRSFDVQVSSLLRNQPIKLFLYNTFVKTKSFHVSTFSSRWFSVLTLIAVTAFNSIMSIGVLLWGLTVTNEAIKLALICLAVSAILDVFTISPVMLFVKCYFSWSAEILLRVPMSLASRRLGTKEERLRRSARGIVEEEIEMMQSLLQLPSQYLKPARDEITADNTPDSDPHPHPHHSLYV